MKGKNNMEPIVIGGIAFGVTIAAGVIFLAVKSAQKNKSPENILETCFGEHTYIQKVSLELVRDWIKNREDKLSNGSKAVVFKLNSENIKNIDKRINMDFNSEKYFAIAVMNTSNTKMIESILIKYDMLDDSLEQFLAKGNGTAVVGG